MVSAGSIVSGGEVVRSLLSYNVRVGSHSRVEESVILPEAEIGDHCRIRRAIIDRGARIPDNTIIGEDPAADRARGFRVSDDGIVLVTPDMLGQLLHFTR